MKNKRFLTMMLVGALLYSCGTTKKSQQQQQTAVAVEFNADTAYAFCAAQCAFGPRIMNSEAHERCGQWIVEQFQRFGYQVHRQQADLRGYDGTVLKSMNIPFLSATNR